MVCIDERRQSLLLANTSSKKPTLSSRNALPGMTIRTRQYPVRHYSSIGTIAVHVVWRVILTVAQRSSVTSNTFVGLCFSPLIFYPTSMTPFCRDAIFTFAIHHCPSSPVQRFGKISFYACKNRRSLSSRGEARPVAWRSDYQPMASTYLPHGNLMDERSRTSSRPLIFGVAIMIPS